MTFSGATRQRLKEGGTSSSGRRSVQFKVYIHIAHLKDRLLILLKYQFSCCSKGKQKDYCNRRRRHGQCVCMVKVGDVITVVEVFFVLIFLPTTIFCNHHHLLCCSCFCCCSLVRWVGGTALHCTLARLDRLYKEYSRYAAIYKSILCHRSL